MKMNRNKKVSFAESPEEFVRMMETYCNMQLGWEHPLTRQTRLWWEEQYRLLEEDYNKKVKEEDQKITLFKHTPVLKIEKVGSQWHDTQIWTGEFHGIMGKVIINA